MLKTPLGSLYVYLNDKPIKYNISPLPLRPIDICSYEVDSRYMIEIDKSQIIPGDIIKFCIDTDIIAVEDGGDCLVEAMFECDDLFLALGGYDINNKDKNNFAYYFSVIKNGIKAEIINLECIQDLNVAIAWSYTDKEDYYTSVWFAADPYV